VRWCTRNTLVCSKKPEEVQGRRNRRKCHRCWGREVDDGDDLECPSSNFLRREMRDGEARRTVPAARLGVDGGEGSVKVAAVAPWGFSSDSFRGEGEKGRGSRWDCVE
jgi:hypothetical protein